MIGVDFYYLTFFCLLISALLVVLGKKGKHHWYIGQADKVSSKMKKIPSTAQRLAYLKKINPYVFEELILTSLAKHGYIIKRNKRYSGDGGIDGKCSLYGQKYLIQAKRYNGSIKKDHVLLFERQCREHKARGLFIHTGKTPSSVVELIGDEITHVEIVSGDRLDRLVTGKK